MKTAKRRPTWFLPAIAFGVTLCLGLAAIAAFAVIMLNTGADPVQEFAAILSTSTPTPRPTWTPVPQETITPTPTPGPGTPQPAGNTESLIADAIGNQLKGYYVDSTLGIMYVNWAIADNLTTGLIQDGAKIDTMSILKAIARGTSQYDVAMIIATFPMKDVYGNVTERKLISLTYKRETIQRINWKNFSFQNVFVIADGGYVDPSLIK